jgi:hypothetical protein
VLYDLSESRANLSLGKGLKGVDIDDHADRLRD